MIVAQPRRVTGGGGGDPEDPLPADISFGSPGRNGYVIPFSFDSVTQDVTGWANGAIHQGAGVTVAQLTLTGALASSARFYLKDFASVDYGTIFTGGDIFLSLDNAPLPPSINASFAGLEIQNPPSTAAITLSNTSNLTSLFIGAAFESVTLGSAPFSAPATWNVHTASSSQTDQFLAYFLAMLGSGTYDGSTITIVGFGPPLQTVNGVNVTSPGSGLPDGDLTFHFEGGSGSGGGGTVQVSGGVIQGATILDSGSWTSPPNVVIDDPGEGSGYSFSTTLGNGTVIALQNNGVSVSTP